MLAHRLFSVFSGRINAFSSRLSGVGATASRDMSGSAYESACRAALQ
jgi:hypothetical protein